MSSQDHVFNQYFLDLLKKLKTKCKEKKEESHDARVILRSIKKNYANNDTLSADFRAYVNSDEVRAVWDTYGEVTAEDGELLRWVDSNCEVCALFRDVELKSVKAMVSDSYMMHHYFTILNIFRIDMSEEDIARVLDVLKNVGKEKEKVDELVGKVESETVRRQLERIVYLYTKRAEKLRTDPLVENIAEIENTSLGKLAKEIMQEVNVDELQKTLGNGDIMSALANPDGGLVKLLGTVSQKMISKMSTGELKQENLLQDAMKLASKMGGGMGPLGDLASMFGGGGGDGGFDMSNLASMMSGMGMGPKAAGACGRARPNTANIKRMRKVKDLRHKLEQKRAKENVSVQVEEVDSE